MNTELIASHGSVEGKKDVLVKDLKGVVNDADELLKAVAGSTSEGFLAARNRVEERLGEVKSRLVDARLALTDRARGVADASQLYLTDNPWKVAGVAAVVGLAIGFLLKRR